MPKVSNVRRSPAASVSAARRSIGCWGSRSRDREPMSEDNVIDFRRGRFACIDEQFVRLAVKLDKLSRGAAPLSAKLAHQPIPPTPVQVHALFFNRPADI